MTSLFVYGTLMPGFPQHDLLAPWVLSVMPAQREGWLFLMPGGYPALVLPDGPMLEHGLVPPGTVHGVQCELSQDATWEQLDAYEGYQPRHPERSLYLRVRDPTRDEGWLYVWNPSRIGVLLERGKPIQGGRFR